MNLKQIRLIFFGLALVLLAGGAGYWLGSHDLEFKWRPGLRPMEVSRRLPSERQSIDLSLFWQVWDHLESAYIDQSALNQTRMVYGAIKGLAASLGDPYTVFLDPEENQKSKEDLGGSFEGVGIQLGYKNGTIAVIAPLEGMPAIKAGVQAGDLILKIDETDTVNITLPEAVNLIRGPKDSKVRLTLLSEGEDQTHEVEIVRGTIIVSSVELEFIPVSVRPDDPASQLAHLKLTRFGERTNGEWNQAVLEIVLNPRVRGVILDLRNNPGGYLGGSTVIASEFLKTGQVYFHEGADGRRQETQVTGEGRLTSLPLVILVNQGSASASEIVAGAIREAGRAQIVGSTTFGKGTIQEAEELEGGAGIHVTTARWLLPSGESVDKKGLEPDHLVADDPETEMDEPLEKAKQLL
jgi:carboxyl-terminal processing protease